MQIIHNMTEKNVNEKSGNDKSGEIYCASVVVTAMRVLKLVLILIVLIMFLNLVGLFSFLKGYFYLLVIAIIGLFIMIVATLILRYIYRGDERARKSLPKLGWLLLALVIVVIMGAAFPSSSRAISMNEERICEENLEKLGHAVERYAAEKGSLPGSLEQLIQEKFLDNIPKVGRSAIHIPDRYDRRQKLLCSDLPGSREIVESPWFPAGKEMHGYKVCPGPGLGGGDGVECAYADLANYNKEGSWVWA